MQKETQTPELFRVTDRVELTMPYHTHRLGTVVGTSLAATSLPKNHWITVRWDFGMVGCYHYRHLRKAKQDATN